MKNYLIALIILFVCTGCPYESPVPITKKADTFIGSFLGKWQRKDENQNYYAIDALGDKRYQIVENAYNEETDSNDITLYQGYISEVGKNLFFNISSYNPNEEASSSDEIMITASPSYHLYKLEITDESSFKLIPLSNYIKEEFKKSANLKKFVEKHMELSFFYGEEEIFVKLKE